jgi:demethylmenaquinone methyltransferase/2-methoxy-6-polyprenyl-1,4-benzoquinol methylase
MTNDTDRLIAVLEGMNPLREPALMAAIDALHLPRGSRGLDIGCGIGDQAILLAAAIGPSGHLTGLDISRPMLDYAYRRASKSPQAGGIGFQQGDMRRLPYAQGAYDWAWSVDCVGYPAGDLLPILNGVSRVVRPGGVMALLGWTSQQLLPGYGMLEARLNANCSPYYPFLEDQAPPTHFQRAMHWFRQAGFTGITCTTLVGQVQAPVRPEIRHALTLLFGMLWGGSIAQAPKPDREEYLRLCSPSSHDFIVDVPEYFGFFTYTMFTGRVSTVPWPDRHRARDLGAPPIQVASSGTNDSTG